MINNDLLYTETFSLLIPSDCCWRFKHAVPLPALFSFPLGSHLLQASQASDLILTSPLPTSLSTRTGPCAKPAYSPNSVLPIPFLSPRPRNQLTQFWATDLILGHLPLFLDHRPNFGPQDCQRPELIATVYGQGSDFLSSGDRD